MAGNGLWKFWSITLDLNQAREKIRSEANELSALGLQFDGLKHQYQAAIVRNDLNLSDQLRAQLHDLLDMQLDKSASCAMLLQAIHNSSW